MFTLVSCINLYSDLECRALFSKKEQGFDIVRLNRIKQHDDLCEHLS